MHNAIQTPERMLMFTLNYQDIIELVMPHDSLYQTYLNQPFQSILSEQSEQQFKIFKQKLGSSGIMMNERFTLKNGEPCYLNGFSDESNQFMIILFENTSEQNLLKKILILASQQLSQMKIVDLDLNTQETIVYEKISKLNNELLNSRRIIEKQNSELQKYNILLKKMSIEDSLTGCYNRRHFYDYLRENILPTQMDETKCLIMIDFNKFKTINDQFGHDAGDRLLITFVKIARDHLKGKGEVFRLGGDEFILLTNHQQFSEANQMMEEINQSFFKYSSISTLAYGIIHFKTCDINSEADLTNMIRKADELMYQHKKTYSCVH